MRMADIQLIAGVPVTDYAQRGRGAAGRTRRGWGGGGWSPSCRPTREVQPVRKPAGAAGIVGPAG
jgi:hypothetical protein